jgi:anti-sigma factor ChrR (cupin superfamily)
MGAMLKLAQWEQRTSWAELSAVMWLGPEPAAHESERIPDVGGRFVLGHPDDPDAPTVARHYFPPGNVTPVHSHRANYSEWILDGTREITRKWYRSGDIQVATAGTFYGPLVAGPSGVLVLALWDTRDFMPISVEEGRRPEFRNRKKFFFKASWDELHQSTDPVSGGVVSAHFVVGEPDDPNAPVVMKTFYPPEKKVDAHTHECTFAHVIVDGSLTDGDAEFGAGDIRIGTPGVVHGPLVAGPMGVNLFTIFRNSRWAPVPA